LNASESEPANDPTSGWNDCAGAWDELSPRFERAVQSVTLKLLERLQLFSGETVVEVACGPGGLIPLLADGVSPGGRVLAGDISPEMLEAAERRVKQTGAAGVQLAEMSLDWLDIPSASAGALVGRFAYMFASDPAAALVEARRVLRPSGRFATAVWDVPARTPFGTVQQEALVEVGLGDPPAAGAPGMFRLAEPGLIEELVASAGFTEVQVEQVDVSFAFDDFDDLVDWTLRFSQRVREALRDGVEGSIAEYRKQLKAGAAAHTNSDGSIALAGSVLVVSGRA
jgi:SAM-dependent methyltransferase